MGRRSLAGAVHALIGSYAIGELYIGQSYPTLGVPGPALVFFEGDPVSVGSDAATATAGIDTFAFAASLDTAALAFSLEGDPVSAGADTATSSASLEGDPASTGS